MIEHTMELGVGDAIRLGNQVATIIDIQDGEVTIRFDDLDDHVDQAPQHPPLPR